MELSVEFRNMVWFLEDLNPKRYYTFNELMNKTKRRNNTKVNQELKQKIKQSINLNRRISAWI